MNLFVCLFVCLFLFSVPVTLVNGPQEPEFVSVPRHKKNPDLGKKTLVRYLKILIEQEDAIRIAEGEEVTLMDWGNAIFNKIEKQNGVVTHIEGKVHLEGDFKSTEKKLTWLPNIPVHHSPSCFAITNNY
jgi:glutamyl-tRNA synthetase